MVNKNWAWQFKARYNIDMKLPGMGQLLTGTGD